MNAEPQVDTPQPIQAMSAGKTVTPESGAELHVGLVGALGSPLEELASALERSLERVGYKTTLVRLSELLLSPELKGRFTFESSPEERRIETAMDAGTNLRTEFKTGEAMAWLAVSQIRALRGPAPVDRRAFVLRSLKHPAELERLRAVYGDQFVAVAIHSPRSERVDRLAHRFAGSAGGRADDYRDRAEKLIGRDEKEQGTKLGQSLRKVFPEADVFVTLDDIGAQVDRFIDLLFGRPVITPTPEEVGMFHAQAAAMRSAALGRQVGAAIATPEGDVIAIGCNEVPREGGGQYWDGDKHDGRDFRTGSDQSDQGKRFVLRELLSALREAGRLVEGANLEEIIAEALDDRDPATKLAETTIANLTEFTRDVHAETAAILTASRIGFQVRGCTLYATTFPCHNCAKHIVAAGIAKVVYREPYPKSYAREFYTDSIEVDAFRECRVPFVPFKGVAPRRYMQWFAATLRKGSDGTVLVWHPTQASPASLRKGADPGLATREVAVLTELEHAVTALVPITPALADQDPVNPEEKGSAS